jgi:ribulose-phosphate 3-epimerase
MHQIIPAVLVKSEKELEAACAAIPPEITFIHLDVLEEDIYIKFPQDFEAHLMVSEPEKIMGKWIDRGAKRLSVHSVHPSLAQFRGQAEIGLAVELDKPLSEVIPFIDFVDYIHLMSIDEIGEQGHKLDERIYARIAELQLQFPNVPISVDGGVNKNNYQKLLELGADRLIVGSGFKELWETLKTT